MNLMKLRKLWICQPEAHRQWITQNMHYALVKIVALDEKAKEMISNIFIALIDSTVLTGLSHPVLTLYEQWK